MGKQVKIVIEPNRPKVKVGDTVYFYEYDDSKEWSKEAKVVKHKDCDTCYVQNECLNCCDNRLCGGLDNDIQFKKTKQKAKEDRKTIEDKIIKNNGYCGLNHNYCCDCKLIESCLYESVDQKTVNKLKRRRSSAKP